MFIKSIRGIRGLAVKLEKLAAKVSSLKVIEKMKESERKRLKARLSLVADRIDVEDELYLTRCEAATKLAQALESRAYSKYVDGLASANKQKKDIGNLLDGLN